MLKTEYHGEENRGYGLCIQTNSRVFDLNATKERERETLVPNYRCRFLPMLLSSLSPFSLPSDVDRGEFESLSVRERERETLIHLHPNPN